MSFCRQCGAELHGPFCTQCGAAQTPEAEAEARRAANPFEAGSQTPSHSAAGPAADLEAADIPGFTGAFTACFRKFGTTRGRASRSEFWYFALWYFLILFLLCLPSGIAGGLEAAGSPSAAAWSRIADFATERIGPWVMLALFIAACFAASRRLHDTNRSGWLVGFWLILGFATTIVDASAPVPDPEAARELNAQGIALGMAVSWLLLTLVIAVLLALRPTPGPNKYGPQPVKRR